MATNLISNWNPQSQVTPAQIALPWLRAKKPWIVPIPGIAKLHRLEENPSAVSVELTTDDLSEIEQAAEAVQIEGKPYPEQLLKTTGL